MVQYYRHMPAEIFWTLHIGNFRENRSECIFCFSPLLHKHIYYIRKWKTSLLLLCLLTVYIKATWRLNAEFLNTYHKILCNRYHESLGRLIFMTSLSCFSAVLFPVNQNGFFSCTYRISKMYSTHFLETVLSR